MECDYKWYSFITRKLPRLDIKDLDKGTTIHGKKKEDEEIFKPEEKMKIGNDNICYVDFQKELYINHTIKENQLEFNLSNGYHFIIIKHSDNINFREMAKKLKANSMVTEEGKPAFFKPKLDNDVNGFIGNMEDSTWKAIMDYKGAIYDIQAKYIKEQDKYIDYDEDIDGKLEFSTFYNLPNAMFSIIDNN